MSAQTCSVDWLLLSAGGATTLFYNGKKTANTDDSYSLDNSSWKLIINDVRMSHSTMYQCQQFDEVTNLQSRTSSSSVGHYLNLLLSVGR